jgi:hypothetical protein
VFPEELANGHAKYVAEATSHELGHALGLEHQSLFSGNTVVEDYNPGTGAVAPIMGNSYSSTRGTWHYGYNGDRVMQDDMSVISRAANGFGYRTDDHGNSAAAATAFVMAGNQVSASGIIHRTSDVDYFSFTTGGGQVSFTVSVPASINNLDARLELRDSSGAVIASAAPSGSFGATITTTVAAGSYRLVVASQGNYGDVGQYTVSGTIVPAAVSSVAAPSGLVATRGASGTTLTWTDNANNETGVYVERRTAGGTWTRIATMGAGARSYVDGAAAAGQTHEYRVRAFGASGESAYSNVATVTTITTATKPAAPGSVLAAVNANRQVQITWRDNSLNETVFVVQRSTNGLTWATLGQVPANSTGAIDATAARGRVYYYRVLAYNSAGYSAASNVSRVIVPSVTTTRAGRTAVRNLPAIQPLVVTPPASQTAKTNVRTAEVPVQSPRTTVTETQAASEATQWQSAVDALFSRRWAR